MLTLISFLIYNEWLLLSFGGKNRRKRINLEVYKNEIELRKKKELCGKYDIWDIEYTKILHSKPVISGCIFVCTFDFVGHVLLLILCVFYINIFFNVKVWR